MHEIGSATIKPLQKYCSRLFTWWYHKTFSINTVYRVDITMHADWSQWHHNGRDGVSNRQPHDCLLNRLFRHRSKKTSKLHFTGLRVGNSSRKGPATGKCFHLMMSSCTTETDTYRNRYSMNIFLNASGQRFIYPIPLLKKMVLKQVSLTSLKIEN